MSLIWQSPEGGKEFRVEYFRRRYDGTLPETEKGEQYFTDLQLAREFAKEKSMYEGNGEKEEATAILYVKRTFSWRMAEPYKKGILNK